MVWCGVDIQRRKKQQRTKAWVDWAFVDDGPASASASDDEEGEETSASSSSEEEEVTDPALTAEHTRYASSSVSGDDEATDLALTVVRARYATRQANVHLTCTKRRYIATRYTMLAMRDALEEWERLRKRSIHARIGILMRLR